MKIYKNPWVRYDCYFLRTGNASSAKMEASSSTGYDIFFRDGAWSIRKSRYYNRTLKEMPVIAETIPLEKIILNHVTDVINEATGGADNDTI